MSMFASTFAILTTTARGESARRSLATKLRQMAELPHGWNYGDGIPVSRVAIAVGERFLLLAARLGLKADVFPSPDGGCAVAFYSGEDRVEVSIGGDGSGLELRVERGIGNHFEDVIPPMENAQVRDVVNWVLWLAPEDEWSLLASSAYASSTAPVGVSSILLLSTPSVPIQVPPQTAGGVSQPSKQRVRVLG